MISTLVLTAGLGTRLDPLTRLAAKAAVPVGPYSLGEHVLLWLKRQGISETVLNLHHLPASITERIGDGSPLDMHVRYSFERSVLGSAGGPRRALSMIDTDPFLIVNGDTLTDVDLQPIIDAHARTRADVTMAVIANPARDHYNGLVADADGALQGVIARGHDVESWHFVGIQVVTKRVFAALPDNAKAETVHGVYKDMIAAAPGSVRLFPVSAAFHDVGTPRDYWDMCQRFGGADTNGNVVWPGAAITAGARVTNTIVAGGITVPDHVTADRAVIVPSAIVKATDSCTMIGDIALFAF